MIQRQLRRRERPPDLIDGLLELHRADPVFMPETDLLMAALMLFLVGLDTAAKTTAAVIYAALKPLEFQAAARANADRLFSNGTLTPQGLSELDYTHRTALEELRRYPALPAMNRTVGTSFELDELRLPAGARLIRATTLTHYLPEFFPGRIASTLTATCLSVANTGSRSPMPRSDSGLTAVWVQALRMCKSRRRKQLSCTKPVWNSMAQTSGSDSAWFAAARPRSRRRSGLQHTVMSEAGAQRFRWANQSCRRGSEQMLRRRSCARPHLSKRLNPWVRDAESEAPDAGPGRSSP